MAFKQIAEITQGDLVFHTDTLKANLKTALINGAKNEKQKFLRTEVYEAFLAPYIAIECCNYIPSEILRDVSLGFLIMGQEVLGEYIENEKNKFLVMTFFAWQLKVLLLDFYFSSSLMEEEKNEEIMLKSYNKNDEKGRECKIESLKDQWNQIERDQGLALKIYKTLALEQCFMP